MCEGQDCDIAEEGEGGFLSLLSSLWPPLKVVWGCSTSPRDSAPMYSPDAQGLYQLCHGIVPGQPLNAFTAKEGVPVEEAASGRKGVLVRPISVAMPDDDGGAPVSVVWRVAWEGGVTQDFELWSGEAAADNGALMVRRGDGRTIGRHCAR